MKKIYLFLLLAVIGITQVFADKAVVNGITYDLDAGNKTAKFAIVDANKNLNIETLTIPATITVSDVVYKVVGFSGEGAFQGGKFKNIVFEEPTNLTDFASWAFIECNNVKEIVVPEGITTFSYNSSMGRMASLEKVVCPSTLTTICDYTWRSNPSLKVVQFKTTTPPATVGGLSFCESTPLQNVTIVVPDGAVDNYCNDDNFGRKLFSNNNQNDGTKNALRNIISESEYNSSNFLARGERLLSSQANYIKDGSLVYIQAAAYTACSPRFIKQVGEEMTWQGGASYSAVWRLVASGKNATINNKTVPTYYFQNVSTGKYAKCINANQRMDMTSEKGEAAEMAIFSISNPPYANGSYHSVAPDYIDANDENSVAIFDITDGNKRLLNNSRFCNLHFNTNNPDVLTWQWNLYKASNEYTEYFDAFEAENANIIKLDAALAQAVVAYKSVAENISSTKTQCEEAKTALLEALNTAKENIHLGIIKGDRLKTSEVQDGDKIIIEAASTTNNYGYYVKDVNGTYKWANGLDNTCVWKVIATGNKSTRYTKYFDYNLQNVATNKYIGAWSNFVMTDDINSTAKLVFFNTTNAPYGSGEYGDKTAYPTGWDDDSWVIYDEVDAWWRNDGGKKASGSLSGSGTHNYQWNVFKASNEYLDYLAKFKSDNELYFYDEALTNAFNTCMTEATDNPTVKQFDTAKTTLTEALNTAKENIPLVKYTIGERLKTSEVQDGDKVIIEAASSSENWGYYIKEDNGSYKWLKDFDQNCVWKMIATGETVNKNGKTSKAYKFQNTETGNFMGDWNGYVMTSNSADAEIYGIFSVKEPPYGNKKYDAKPIGWDNESWIMWDKKDKFLHNNTFEKNGDFAPSRTDTYTWQWNAYKASNEYADYLKAFKKENAGWFAIDADLLSTYNTLMTEATQGLPNKLQFDAAKTALAEALAAAKATLPEEAGYTKGARVKSTEAKDGDLIIIEAASTTKNYGYYIKDDNSEYKWKEGIDVNSVWKLIATGNKFFLQNIGTKKYVGAWNGMLMVENISDAKPAELKNVKNCGLTVGEYNDKTAYPTGWDDDSWVIVCDAQYWRNDVGKKASGSLWPGEYSLHTLQWNVFKAVPALEKDGKSIIAGEITAEDVANIKKTNTAGAIDFTNAELSNLTADDLQFEGNTMAIVSADANIKGTNIIVKNGDEYTCEELVLTDRMSFGPGVEFTATSATLTKPSIDGGLYTMYLPYAYSKPNNTVVYTFEGATDNVLKFEEFTDETIPAYTPVLFQRTDDNTETLSFGGANVTISDETTGSVDFKGTLKFMDANEVANGNIKYILNADGTKFSKAIAGATIPAFRCYLEATSSTSNEFTIVLEDVTGAKTILKGAEAQKVFNTLGVVGETNGVNVTTTGKKYVK